MGRRQLGALAAALLVGAAPAAWGHPPSPAASPGGRLTTAPSLAVIRPAPDFSLPDVAGADVKLSELRGSIVLLSFIYTSCAAACPLLTQPMAVLQGRLTDARLLPGEVTLLPRTGHPHRDSAAVLARYAQAFPASPPRWPFLPPHPDRLGPVLTPSVPAETPRPRC